MTIEHMVIRDKGETNHVILGHTYRDRHTGFEGVATARTEYEFRCALVCLERIGDPTGIDVHWIDEPRLVPADTSRGCGFASST